MRRLRIARGSGSSREPLAAFSNSCAGIVIHLIYFSLVYEDELPDDIGHPHENAEILAEKLANFDYSEDDDQEAMGGEAEETEDLPALPGGAGEEEQGSSMTSADPQEDDGSSGSAAQGLSVLMSSGQPYVGVISGGEGARSFRRSSSGGNFNVDFSGEERSSQNGQSSRSGSILKRSDTATSGLSQVTDDSLDASGSISARSAKSSTLRRNSGGGGAGGKVATRRKKKDKGKLDLFEQVMENGKGLVYDPSVGQFRERRGIRRRTSISPADLANLHGVNDHFHYVKFMKREKEAMTYKMNLLMKEANEGESHAMTNEEMEKKMLKGRSVLASNLYKECALCEKVYRPWNLPGIVPFKSVADWRMKHGAGFPKKDRRWAQSRIYEPVQLCLFCTQFFDADFSDFVEYHLGSTDIVDPALEIEDLSGKKNELDAKVTKSLQEYSQKGIVKQDFVRPGSAFLQEMELDALRDKRYLPKLMSNMGCDLARAVLPENVPTKLFQPTTKHGGLGSSHMAKKKVGRKGGGKPGMSQSGPVKLESITQGGRKVSRRELLLESLKQNETESLSPKSRMTRMHFEKSELKLRQSGINLKVGSHLKRKKKKRGSLKPATLPGINSHKKLESLMAEDSSEDGDAERLRKENVGPNLHPKMSGRGMDKRRKKKKSSEESVYRMSMKKASTVYV